MGRASQALKQVLDTYGISQNQLAGAMGVERGSVSRWYHDKRDPTAETVVEIVEALKALNFQAAEDFMEFYLGRILKIEVDVSEASQEDGNKDFL